MDQSVEPDVSLGQSIAGINPDTAFFTPGVSDTAMDDPIAYVRSKLICHGKYNQAVSELDEVIAKLNGKDVPAGLVKAVKLAKLYCLLRIPE